MRNTNDWSPTLNSSDMNVAQDHFVSKSSGILDIDIPWKNTVFDENMTMISQYGQKQLKLKFESSPIWIDVINCLNTYLVNDLLAMVDKLTMLHFDTIFLNNDDYHLC